MLKRLGAGTIVVALLSVVMLTLGASCPPKPPGPTPTPTPTPVVDTRPTSPVYLDRLLRQQGGYLVVDGKPFQLIGAIPCWPTCDDGCLRVDGKLVDYWWSLASPQWIDAVKPKGVNAIHVRLGPVRGVDQCCGMQSVGGPYQETSAVALRKLRAKVRLPAEKPLQPGLPPAEAPPKLGEPAWNQNYWNRVHQVLNHAGRNQFIVEVDVLDGWQVKHSQWGELTMPMWPAQDVVNAADVPLNPSVKAWVKKVIHETCFYGNVIYQISNESPGIVGWSPYWEQTMLAEIQADEAAEGCVVHMKGSNSTDYSGGYDYFQQHNAGIVSPIAGRPVMENEWNPHASPASFSAMCKGALAQGTGCWYWRSDGSDADQDASLNSILQPVDPGCPDPKPDKNLLTFSLSYKGNGIFDSTPQQYNSCAYCESIGMKYMPDGHTIRCNCPERNECGPNGPLPAEQDPANPGPSFQCDKRLSCEQYVMEASAPVFTSDGAVDFMDDNHFRVRCNGTWLKACDASGQHCAEEKCP